VTIYKAVPLDSPAAALVAEMHGVVFDLQAAAFTCHLFLDEKAPLAPALFEPVATAAVIRYARCFSSGVRPKMPAEIIGTLDESQRALHQYILDLRNKFLAHSVNPYERNYATAMVPEEPSPAFRIEGLGFQQERFGYPSRELMIDFFELIEEVKKRASAWVHDESRTAIDEANRIGAVELAKREMLTAGEGLGNAWEDVAKSRLRLRPGATSSNRAS